MGYYQGDFYRAGGRGDPGFFSFLGGVARSFLGLPAAAPAASTAIQKIVASPIVKRAVSTIAAHPVLTAAGAAGAAGLAAGALKGGMRGAPSAAGMASAMRRGGGGGKRRRMRVTNPKALRRALRRAYGFERLAMRTIHLLHPKKKGRFGGFRRPKKRAA